VSGSAYNVTVGTQPTNVSQTCTVAAGAGTATANVTSVSVVCSTNSFPVSVTVDGLFSDLIFGDLVLENDGGDPLTLTKNGAATFANHVASGAAYNVAVREQPNGTPQQTCTVSSGTGTVGNGPVTNITVHCSAKAGRFLYTAVAGPPTNGVAAFAIDASTGALAPLAGSPFAAAGQAPRVLFADPSGRFLYVYGDDNTGAPGETTLTGFTVDAQTGALEPIAGLLEDLPAAATPVVIHPSGRFFYLPVSDGALSSNNRLLGFAVDATTGALTSVPGFPWGPFAAGEVLNGAVVSPNGENLYLAMSTPGVPQTMTLPTATLLQLTVDEQTGELSGPASSYGDAANTFNQIFMHPDGTHLYTRNAMSAPGTPPPGDFFASRFTLDTTTGAIGGRFDFRTKFGFGVVITPLRRGVYFPEFGGTFAVPGPGAFTAYRDHASDQVGTFVDSPYATGGSNSISPALDPTGRFIAITNLGSSTVSIMKIHPLERWLSQSPGSPYTPAVGNAPGSVRFDPSARFAYLTDAAGSISSYRIDVDTGEPTFVSSQPTGGSPAPVPVVIIGTQ
jgi:hypothetical protein